MTRCPTCGVDSHGLAELLEHVVAALRSEANFQRITESPCHASPSACPKDTEMDRIRAECRSAGIAVGLDDTVTRKQAAHLLNMEPDTLRKRADIRPVKGGHRKRYALRTIAEARPVSE